MSDSISHRCRHHYRVYGLTLGANIEIPGLDAEKVAGGKADIEINMGFFPDDIQRLIKQPSAEYYLEPGYKEEDPPHLIIDTLADGKYFYFQYEYGVDFVVDQNSTIVWCKWKPSLVLEDAVLYLLGPVVGFMLRLRGITCLHASGVVVDGKAFALTGLSGAGKSTLAASFAAAGYPVLTDDILPLLTTNNVVHTRSGYSRLRLFPNSFENLQELPDSLPLMTPSWDKCYLDLSSGSFELCSTPTPLEVVYIIDWSVESADRPTISTLSPASAIPILSANTYRSELLDPDMRTKEFTFLGHLVSKVKVKKLHPANDILSVPRMREVLLEDFQRETASKAQATQCTVARKDD